MTIATENAYFFIPSTQIIMLDQETNELVMYNTASIYFTYPHIRSLECWMVTCAADKSFLSGVLLLVTFEMRYKTEISQTVRTLKGALTW